MYFGIVPLVHVSFDCNPIFNLINLYTVEGGTEIKKPYHFTAPKFGKLIKINIIEILSDELYLAKLFA